MRCCKKSTALRPTKIPPGCCIGCDMKVGSGNPDRKHVSTSYAQRHNSTMRMSMRRFTRPTNAFPKKIANYAAMQSGVSDNVGGKQPSLRCKAFRQGASRRNGGTMTVVFEPPKKKSLLFGATQGRKNSTLKEENMQRKISFHFCAVHHAVRSNRRLIH